MAENNYIGMRILKSILEDFYKICRSPVIQPDRVRARPGARPVPARAVAGGAGIVAGGCETSGATASTRGGGAPAPSICRRRAARARRTIAYPSAPAPTMKPRPTSAATRSGFHPPSIMRRTITKIPAPRVAIPRTTRGSVLAWHFPLQPRTQQAP
jgi:hypothetical protein